MKLYLHSNFEVKKSKKFPKRVIAFGDDKELTILLLDTKQIKTIKTTDLLSALPALKEFLRGHGNKTKNS